MVVTKRWAQICESFEQREFHKRKNYVFPVDNPCKGSFEQDAHNMSSIICMDPVIFYRDLKLKQPCPVHAWNSTVKRKGFIDRLRRVCDIDRNMWLAGALYMCVECKAIKNQKKSFYYSLLTNQQSSNEQKVEALNDRKNTYYYFRSYDPQCTQHWLSGSRSVGCPVY